MHWSSQHIFFLSLVLNQFKEKRAPMLIFRMCNSKIRIYTLQIDECTSKPKLWRLVLRSHACPVQSSISMEYIEWEWSQSENFSCRMYLHILTCFERRDTYFMKPNVFRGEYSLSYVAVLRQTAMWTVCSTPIFSNSGLLPFDWCL